MKTIELILPLQRYKLAWQYIKPPNIKNFAHIDVAFLTPLWWKSCRTKKLLYTQDKRANEVVELGAS